MEEPWILHCDNAPAHISMLVREFLSKNKTVIMPQLPYTPDDFFFFPKLKTPMKLKHFATIEEMKEKSSDTKKRVSEVFRGLEKTLA